LCACEMLFPNCGPLPQTWQTCAMTYSTFLDFFGSPGYQFRWRNDEVPVGALGKQSVFLAPLAELPV
jgi:hypothetical protein